jgi:hypothetical protein
MENHVNGRDGDEPFYEIRQRYCSKLNGNVVMKRELGSEGEFTCLSSHMCGEDCKRKESGKRSDV